MTIAQKLYDNWLCKLAALKAVNEQHDYSPEGQAAYYIAFMEAKQAYELLYTHEAAAFDKGMQAVYG
jgi:hypothetical protein